MKFEIIKSNRLGIRAALIKRSGFDYIKTPTLALTSVDLGAIERLQKVGLFKNWLDDIPHRIIEVNERFSQDRLNGLKQENDPTKLLELIKPYAEYLDKLIIFVPILNKGVFVDEKANDILIETQLQAGYQNITITDNQLFTPEEFKERLLHSADLIRKNDPFEYGENADIFVLLDIDSPTDILKEKLNIAFEFGVAGIILKYAFPKTHFSQYKFIKEFASKKEIYIHISGVPKTNPYKNYIDKHSLLVLALSLSGADSYSIRPQIFISSDSNKTVRLKPTKLFDKDTWGALPVRSIKGKLYTFPILNKSDTVREFLNEFHNKSKLIDAIRIYDRLAILLEFSKLRDSVINDKFLEFIKQKRYGVSAAEKIFNLNLRNATLPQ